MSLLVMGICFGLGLLMAFTARHCLAPFKGQLLHLRTWLWLAAAPCSFIVWLKGAPLPSEDAARIGFAPLFPGYRHLSFHRINQPKNGSKRAVILGPSHMAGWAADYRGSLFDSRHKHDIWGRASIAASMEQLLSRRGTSSRIENLGIQGGDIWTEFSLFLYALERKPDMIIHGLASASFSPHPPENIPEVTRDILSRLSRWQYEGKRDLEQPLLKMMIFDQKDISAAPTIFPSYWEGIVGRLGGYLLAGYQGCGLPPLVVKTQDPLPSSQALWELFNQPTQPWYQERERTAMTDPYLNFPLIMHRIAQQEGIPYVIVLPSDLCVNAQPFYERYGGLLRKRGIRVLDLSKLGLRYGTETYDGAHCTPKGNAITAEAILKYLSENHLFP